MSFLVLKFGGSSVGTIARMGNVSSIIHNLLTRGHKVVVVVSAMHGVTNQLLELTKNFIDISSDRECDVVVSTGEQVTSGLLALSLKKIGVLAKSFQGWQVPVITETVFGEASIKSVNKDILIGAILEGIVPIVSGFQGISNRNDITTIGRGGSDATAVAIANALQADECFIYTDVDGVYTADPRIVLGACKLECISYSEMLEMSKKGSKVLQAKSVQIAQDNGVKLRVLSSFKDNDVGTAVGGGATKYPTKNAAIAGIANDMNSFMLKTNNKNFKKKSIPMTEIDEKTFVINKIHQNEVKNTVGEFDNDIGIVSVIGQDSINLNQRILKSLRNNKIVVKKIYSSDKSLSIVTPFQQTEIAVNILHKEFFE
ncbi:MAG: aspartate kinase [Holosporales bacterium]|jgi:aspartate kinase|nr:aspartate kinase [Holosporales bacterium]